LLDPITNRRYYSEPGETIVDEYGSTIDFYPSHVEGEPYPWNPEDWWEIELAVNYTLAAMPPPEILSYFGNPFLPSEALKIPIDGNVFAVVSYTNTATSELWTEYPTASLLLGDVGASYGDTVFLGSMTAGDSIRFYIRSSNTIVNGSNLYPKKLQEETYNPDGTIRLWRLQFEDWTDLLFDNIEIEIYVQPDSGLDYSPVAVLPEPAGITPGDTAQIIIKRRYLDGTLDDFPGWQTFEVGMLDGCAFGKLHVEGMVDTNYFYDVMQPIYFIADTAAESGTVKVRVGVIESGGSSRPIKNDGITQNNKTMMKTGNVTESFCFYQTFETTNLVGDGPLSINTILLGETKYFGVKKRVKNGVVQEIKIEEIPTVYGNEPEFPADADGWVWLKTDVWGDEPVTKVEGDKLGVYWEKGKPVWNGSIKGNNLATGLIRLIGKYWAEGENYKVKLNANTQDGKTASLEIEIKKPQKLLSPKSGLKKPMNIYKDIDGTEKNIDEICIKNGGKFGIPPHYLKGQMFGEAAINISIGVFYPSYRYEPYTTQWDKYLKSWSGKFYFKDKVSADFSDVPNHSNVKYLSYWTVAKTVWEIIDENSQLTNKNNPSHYGKRKDDNTMDFDKDNFPWLQKKYDEILELEKKREELELEKQVDSANVKMVKWLKEKWNDGKANTEVAQTRCASSYGLLQMLYTTARGEKGYSSIEVPEKLNDLLLLEHWVEYQSDLLGTKITENNWHNGFEEDFKTYVFKKWNKASSYPGKIFSNSKKFLPQ
jgi:hypothetical protein